MHARVHMFAGAFDRHAPRDMRIYGLAHLRQLPRRQVHAPHRQPVPDFVVRQRALYLCSTCLHVCVCVCVRARARACRDTHTMSAKTQTDNCTSVPASRASKNRAGGVELEKELGKAAAALQRDRVCAKLGTNLPQECHALLRRRRLDLPDFERTHAAQLYLRVQVCLHPSVFVRVCVCACVRVCVQDGGRPDLPRIPELKSLHNIQQSPTEH